MMQLGSKYGAHNSITVEEKDFYFKSGRFHFYPVFVSLRLHFSISPLYRSLDNDETVWKRFSKCQSHIEGFNKKKTKPRIH